MARKLVLMGSGENSPAMVTPHQNILKELGKSTYRINLDTPYGFQENADEMTARILGYFEKNVGSPIEDVHFRNSYENAATALEEIDKADWIFSGPGSPTYALKEWSSNGVAEKFGAVLERGSIVMASAAAMTLGYKTMPVYEMYKVGDAPFWLDGLNVLEKATGLRATVIAHYNNTQGGTHDTRFCFVGERRMKALEAMLEADVAILGLDEHTGVSFDLDTKVVEVFGKGQVTYRLGGQEKVFPAKTSAVLGDFAF
jgi:cyanophycinase-like exopeptidase